MKSYFRFDGDLNLAGYYTFFFIEDDRVVSIPTDVDGVVNADDIVYTGIDNRWYSGAAIIKTLDLGSQGSITPNGTSYAVKIEGLSAYKNAHNLKLFHEKTFKRFIIIMNDRNGHSVICGEPGNGIPFYFKEVKGGLNFTYAGAYTKPCWFIDGNINVDGVIYGASYIPGASSASTIKGDRGSIWLFGSTVPSNLIGLNDDLYLRDNPLEIYTKVAGAWVLQSDLATYQRMAKQAIQFSNLRLF